MKNFSKNTKAITLIALVVTIVVLLILAAVSISMLGGENGIITQAINAKKEFEEKQKEEENSLINNEELINSILGNETKVNDDNPGELSGDGSEGNPYLIESIEDLVAFSNAVNNGTTYKDKIIKLKQSLNFTSDLSYIDPTTTIFGDINKDGKTENIKTELTTGRGFNPIGNVELIQIGSDDFGTDTVLIGQAFEGTFDGNEKAIKELKMSYNEIDEEQEEYLGIGLFGWNKGLITNLATTGTIFDNSSLICGGISAYSNGIVKNCINNTNISSNGMAGGIVGGELGSLNVENCINKGKLQANNVAGILGISMNDEMTDDPNINIINCTNENDIKGAIAGGIASHITYTTTLIQNSSNNGKIESTFESQYLGGIVGIIQNPNVSYTEISRCYNKGEIENTFSENTSIIVGGLVGKAYTWSNYSSITIKESFNIAKIGNANEIGGIVGNCEAYGGEISIQDCYNGLDITGIGYIGGIAGNIEVKTDGTIEIIRTYNFGNVIGEGIIYIGGIIGNIKASKQYFETNSGIINIYNNYNLGKILNNNTGCFAGGIIGNISNSLGYITIEDNYNSGSVNTYGNYTGGIIGKINSYDNINIINCCYNNDQNIGGISGEDTLNSAYFLENLPEIIEVLGQSYKEDTLNINNGLPILIWQ